MAEGLRLKVEADLSQAEKALGGFVQTAQKDGRAAGTALSQGLNTVTPAATRATAAINKYSDATRKAKFSTIEASRVLQDLPFGFTGIANNLTQLIPGVGLAGLAFSGLVSALTFSQVGLSAWTRGAKGAQEQAVLTTNEIEKAKEFQNKFGQAVEDASQKLIGQAGELKDLRRELENTNNDYITLTDTIIKKGVAEALFSKKSEAAQKLIADAISNSIRVAEGSVANLDTLTDLKPRVLINQFGQDLDHASREVEAWQKRTGLTVDKGSEQIIAQMNKLARIIGVTFDGILKTPKGKKEIEFEPKFNLKNLQNLLIKPGAFEIKELNIRGIKIPPVPEPEINKLREQLEKSIKNKPAEVTFKVKQDQAALDKLAKDFANLSDNVFKTMQQAAVDSIANLGEAIGTAIAGGDLGKVFANFGNILGSAIQQIGKQLIEFGTLAILTKKALSTAFANPGLAIGVGIALSALGATIKATLSKGIKGFAEGGLVFGPTLGLVGEGQGTRPSNPEVIAPLDKLRGFMGQSGAMSVVVTGRWRANDFVLGNARGNRQNRRLGAR